MYLVMISTKLLPENCHQTNTVEVGWYQLVTLNTELVRQVHDNMRNDELSSEAPLIKNTMTSSEQLHI